MVAELFKTATATQIVHIPYKGNGAAITESSGHSHVQVLHRSPELGEQWCLNIKRTH